MVNVGDDEVCGGICNVLGFSFNHPDNGFLLIQAKVPVGGLDAQGVQING